MSQLASSVFVAARPLAGRSLLALGIPTALLCGAIIVKGAPLPAAEAVHIDLPAPADVAIHAPAVVRDSAPERGALRSRDISLVFSTRSGLYMTLANVEGGAPLPTHEKPVHVPATDRDWTETAVARIAPSNVPAVYAAWIGRDVVVDGSCTATVTNIAVAARLIGDTGYAGDGADGAWTVKNVLEYGTKMIVAELDGCTSGSTARAATLANPLEMQTITDRTQVATLTKAAKKAVIRSKESRIAQKAWEEPWLSEGVSDGRAKTWWQSDETEWKTTVFRHPISGVTFVSVHAQQPFACGGPEVNVWGLYRVEDNGELVALDATLGDIYQVDKFIDVDHDGMPEILGAALLGGTLINDVHGASLSKLEMQFYGCPC